MNKQLRKYQQEAIDAVIAQGKGSKSIIALSVGLGKSFTAASIPRNGRVLWLCRQRQLAIQPVQYFPNCTIGFEMAELKSNGEEIIFATVQSISRRLDKFKPDDFYLVVADEVQEGKGADYEKVIKYFNPYYSVGLSGTPFRMDGKKLTDGLYDSIVYQRDIKFGIENGYLCDVKAVRCYIDYDLSGIKTSNGDFNQSALEDAMSGTENAIAEAYEKYSEGRQTLIFATGVDHANKIASKIDGARVVIGSTKQHERDDIFNGFTNKEIPCIVSVNVMTQGIDLPISTVGIFAKPTKSIGRYQQQVGRILRTHPEKEFALIVDCCGVSNKGLCSAPNILGIDIDKVPENKQKEIEGDLLELAEKVEELSDCVSSWIKNTKNVDLWSKANNINTLSLNLFQHSDGRMVISLPERKKIIIPPMNILGKVDARDIIGLSAELLEYGLKRYGEQWEYQTALNATKAELERNYGNLSMVWDLKKTKGWGKKEPSEAQLKSLATKLKRRGEEVPQGINRFEASMILNRLNLK